MPPRYNNSLLYRLGESKTPKSKISYNVCDSDGGQVKNASKGGGIQRVPKLPENRDGDVKPNLNIESHGRPDIPDVEDGGGGCRPRRSHT